MKANELRIGNLVKNNEPRYGDKILVIESIGDNDTVNVFFRQYPMSELEPLPLTEEWLLKFGFYKNIDTELFEKGGFQIEISVLKCLFYLPEFGDWHKEIEYVHQLQNLWFALTSEELTIAE